MPKSDYGYTGPEAGHMHRLLLPALRTNILESSPDGNIGRVFDLGCGNGSVAAALCQQGIEVSGVDPSLEGIALANQAYPELKLELGSGDDDLAQRFGTFACVYSLEVIEHVFEPRRFVRTAWELLEPGGTLILSTPYHGYLKNLTLALSGKLDAHFTALWDYGHIKFWSPRTITLLLAESGFEVRSIDRLGRVPPLAMTMMITARKPQAGAP